MEPLLISLHMSGGYCTVKKSSSHRMQWTDLHQRTTGCTGYHGNCDVFADTGDVIIDNWVHVHHHTNT